MASSAGIPRTNCCSLIGFCRYKAIISNTQVCVSLSGDCIGKNTKFFWKGKPPIHADSSEWRFAVRGGWENANIGQKQCRQGPKIGLWRLFKCIGGSPHASPPHQPAPPARRHPLARRPAANPQETAQQIISKTTRNTQKASKTTQLFLRCLHGRIGEYTLVP